MRFIFVDINRRQQGGNSIRVGEGTVQKYVNHQAGTTKASARIILVQMMMYNIFRLLVGVPDHSSESCREEQKLIGFMVIISRRGVCK